MVELQQPGKRKNSWQSVKMQGTTCHKYFFLSHAGTRNEGTGVLVHCWLGFTRAWCMARLATKVFPSSVNTEASCAWGVTTGATEWVDQYINSSSFPENPWSDLMLDNLRRSLEFERTRIDKDEFFVHKRCTYQNGALDESNVVSYEYDEGEGVQNGGFYTDHRIGERVSKGGRVVFERLLPELYQIPRDCQNIDHVEDVSVIKFPGVDKVRREVLLRACGGEVERLLDMEKRKRRNAARE